MRIPFGLAGFIVVACLATCPGAALAISPQDTPANDAVLQGILARLDAVELQNRQLAAQVAELAQQNAVLLAGSAAPVQVSTAVTPGMRLAPSTAAVATLPAASTTPAAGASKADEWTDQIRFAGDFRFRHENIDDSAKATDRSRETIRARFGAAIRVSDSIDGEIAIASGGADPRGASSILGSASSRKEIGLDLGYMTWRPSDGLGLTVGKMREPYVRPGRSMFFDNEIRPEGIAASYKGADGFFGTAFRFWLEERPEASDSTLLGTQVGWRGELRSARLMLGAGYYDYQGIEGRSPQFGDGLVNEFGNSVVDSGADTVYAYDYDIGQLFADATLPVAGIPLNLFADYAYNFAADNGLDTAVSLGVLLGKADETGRWEGGVMLQRVEKDALFAHWTDSDFAGGVTDNDGLVYRIAWMPIPKLLVNLTYLDTSFNVDVGDETDYDRWQLDFNVKY